VLSVGDMLAMCGPVVHAGPPVRRPTRIVGFFSSHPPGATAYNPEYQRLPWVHAQEVLMKLIDDNSPSLVALICTRAYAEFVRVLKDHASAGSKPWMHWPSRTEADIKAHMLLVSEEVNKLCQGRTHRLAEALLQDEMNDDQRLMRSITRIIQRLA
jgi:hypothetical protein